MISWQGRLFKTYYRIQRFFHPPTGELDVDQERAKLEGLARQFKTKIEMQCTVVDADTIPAEWIVPPGVLTGRVIFYLHGGGYHCGSIDSHRSLAADIANAAQGRALIIDYRLAPEDPFPAAVDDALTAYRWLFPTRSLTEAPWPSIRPT